MQAVASIPPAPETAIKPSNRETVDWLRAVASERDREAFERLYRQFASRIKSYMVRQGADDATADDLAQETMVRVWKNVSKCCTYGKY